MTEVVSDEDAICKDEDGSYGIETGHAYPQYRQCTGAPVSPAR